MIARSARLFAALLVAAPFATAPLSAQGVEYAPGTTKYRITTATTGSQSSPMGSANFEVSIHQDLTVNLMRHAKDTVMATMTIDSIALNSNGPAPDPSTLRGSKFVSLLSPTGKFYSTKGPDGIDPQLAQLADVVARFIPSHRGNIAQGTAWADTTSGKVTQAGMSVDQTTVTNYKVDGDTTIAGQKAVRISRTTSVKAAGSGNMNGSPVTMETTGTRAGAFFITDSGHYLGGNSIDDVVLKITILAQNVEVTVKSNAKMQVEAIK